MGIIKNKILKYDKYFIEIDEEELEDNNLKNTNNVVIESEKEHENKSRQLREYITKLESINLEMKLQNIKLKEKDLEVQKTIIEKKKIEENYAFKLNELNKKYKNETKELKQLIEIKDDKIDEMKKEHEKENQSLTKNIKEENNFKKQIEIYKVGNKGLKNDNQIKEAEILKLKNTYKDIEKTKIDLEKELRSYKVELRHLEKVNNEKEENIIKLEEKIGKFEQNSNHHSISSITRNQDDQRINEFLNYISLKGPKNRF